MKNKREKCRLMDYIIASSKLEYELRIAFLSLVGSPFTEKEIKTYLKKKFKVSDAEIHEMVRRCKDTLLLFSEKQKGNDVA